MKVKIHRDIKQGTPEWYKIREGRMTGSEAQAIGNAKEGLNTLILKIVAEMYSTERKKSFSNSQMERGKTLEPAARMVYEFEESATVEDVGFVTREDDDEMWKYVGVSPDGLIGEDGGLEIKCLDDVQHLEIIDKKLAAVASKYKWQVQMNLLVTGRKWWDLAIYNPHMPKPLMVFRIEPDEIMHKRLLTGFQVGIEKIKLIKSKI